MISLFSLGRKVKVSIPLLFLAFFILLGYLEATWTGAIAGGIMYGISTSILPLALIPFGGAIIWYMSITHLNGLLFNFIDITVLNTGIISVSLFISILLTLLTTLPIIGLVAFWYNKTRTHSLDLLSNFQWQDFLKGINLDELINKIMKIITDIWDKLDKDLVGSSIFWFGMGLAIHDFWWEQSEDQIDTMRPTHGCYTGLEIAMFGIGVMITGLNWTEKIKKTWKLYIGLVMAYIGFFILRYLPKGISRLLAQVIWWPSIALMVYNWYELVQHKLIPLPINHKLSLQTSQIPSLEDTPLL